MNSETKTVRSVTRQERPARPLHKSFTAYSVTNRAMRRDKKLVARMLREAIKSGDMLRYQVIDEEVSRAKMLRADREAEKATRRLKSAA